MKLQNFCILCVFDGFLNFWECFFCGKHTKPCCHARTFQLVSQQSLASINNKNLKIAPSGTQRHHWGIGILSIQPIIVFYGAILSAILDFVIGFAAKLKKNRLDVIAKRIP